MSLPKHVQLILSSARVARLATIGSGRRPHLVPVCFVFHQGLLYTPIDRKPKRVPPRQLARVQNIAAESRVALLVDHYEEDWTKLWYILIRGTAYVLRRSAKAEHESAMKALRSKYQQYAAGMLKRDAMLIRIEAQNFIFWSADQKSS